VNVIKPRCTAPRFGLKLTSTVQHSAAGVIFAAARGAETNQGKLPIGAAVLFFACVIMSAAAAAGACPLARPEIQVDADHGEVQEVSDVTLTELARIAGEQAVPPPHRLLGAYSRTIGIGLRIEDAVVEAGGGRCTVPQVVYVRLALMDRAVHLPRDFADDPCLLDLSRGHERRHAHADDALFDRLIARYPEDLRTRFAVLALEPAPSVAAARLRMTVAARSVVEQQLDSYQYAQASRAGEAVDTPEEVARLRESCGGALKLQDGL
jgi:hypothetical protein